MPIIQLAFVTTLIILSLLLYSISKQFLEKKVFANYKNPALMALLKLCLFIVSIALSWVVIEIISVSFIPLK
ncbi:MAG: putative membrane protein [Arenicella sp.]|jgi:uncharacterized membrane protein